MWPRLGSVIRWLGKGLVYLTALCLIILGLALSVVETAWAKNQLRSLIVREANQYLTATLEIGRLEGSLVRGLQLGDIRLSRGGQPIIAIDEVLLSYSPRELWQNGTVIRRIRLVRPRFSIAKEPDGRWNLGALVKREVRQERNAGPGRPIDILAIEVVDGRVSLGDPLEFGAAHVPSEFTALNTVLSFRYQPVTWTLDFAHASWIGRSPDLDMTNLSGRLSNGPAGWRFDRFSVVTPRSAFSLDGPIQRREGTPTTLDLEVRATRFMFQEWSEVLHGLKNIAVGAQFTTRLHGPLDHLDTDLQLSGTGGSVTGSLILDTTVPGWHARGAVYVGRLDLARWLNRPDRPSDISGHVVFNLDLDLGGHFPRGSYSFNGPHASFMDYGADNVRARGQLTATQVEIAEATATAYGAGVMASSGSTIALDDPFGFRFRGTITQIDLRQLPRSVPVPHVESRLTFNYDVTGRFKEPFISGQAVFAPSQFLGVALGAGTFGTIDTSATPTTYSGEGDVESLNLNRLGAGLDIAWMQDPHYAGVIAGHFRVQGAGADGRSVVTGGGRISRAAIFHGTIADADVSLNLAGGTLDTSFSGRFAQIDPSVPLGDPRFSGRLTGTAAVRARVADLLTRTPTLIDYDLDGSVQLGQSLIRDITVDTAHVQGNLKDGIGRFTRFDLSAPALSGSGTGAIAFTRDGVSAFDYDVSRADLAQLAQQLGRQDIEGLLTTKGHLAGPAEARHFAGDATVSTLRVSRISATNVSGTYDITVPAGSVAHAAARVELSASFLAIAGRILPEARGLVTMAGERIGFDLHVAGGQGRQAGFTGSLLLNTDRRDARVEALTVAFGRAPWRLVATSGAPAIRWNDDAIVFEPITFAGGTADARISIAGDWRYDGRGALQVTAEHVFLDTFEGAFEGPARYGGVLALNATIRGTSERPILAGNMTITDGRVRRVSYQKLAGHFDYAAGIFQVDLRLDQSPGVWLTAKGSLPLSLLSGSAGSGSDQPIDVRIASSPINLGLVEGITDVVRNVSGTLHLDLEASGTARDPRFEGLAEITNGAFQVTAAGSRYKNARARIQIAQDRIMIDMLHVEDASGRPLDLRGSLGTHALQVGDLEVDATAQHFEVIRNELGKIDIDAALHLRGRVDLPRVTGDLTINSGELQVDTILERVFQPYPTEQVTITDADPVAALHAWDRLGLDISLHVPNTLKLSGDNVQVSPGTPIGLGNIKLHVAGDLYLYKDPRQPFSITGSFDSISGTYAFQGRQFEVDANSSINFRGDLNPDLFVSVTRVISGVQARVTISGPLGQPELQLSSTPPLDSSDILSLIVFNTAPNQLSVTQAQELAVRAGALAAGFIATPLISALQNELGLEVLQVDPTGDLGGGPKITVGTEFAPGLVARFSRQFGSEPYDQATIEYSLSRILRLRATFSDAQTLEARSPFRRIERAGIDLIFFFSF